MCKLWEKRDKISPYTLKVPPQSRGSTSFSYVQLAKLANVTLASSSRVVSPAENNRVDQKCGSSDNFTGTGHMFAGSTTDVDVI